MPTFDLSSRSSAIAILVSMFVLSGGAYLIAAKYGLNAPLLAMILNGSYGALMYSLNASSPHTTPMQLKIGRAHV